MKKSGFFGPKNIWKSVANNWRQNKEQKNLQEPEVQQKAIQNIWSAYNKKSVFDADIIYILDVVIKRGYNLHLSNVRLNSFVKVKCGFRSFTTRIIRNTSSPEWNESIQFHFRQHAPREISFEVFNNQVNESNNHKYGDCNMEIDPDYFKSDHRGMFT